MAEVKNELKKIPVTAALLIVNIVVFLLVDFTGGGSEDGAHMLECGALYAPYVLEKGEYYRFFTSMFLHFGIYHLANNMLVLFVLGERLEPLVGKVKYLLIYLIGGIGGNLLSFWLETRSGDYAISAGASGAVFGVMGAMIYVLVRHKGRVKDLTIRGILVMAAFSLYFGFASSGVDNAAHVGGLLCAALAALLLYHPRKI